jgi:septal ring factor EnvC (AmiA/AmiB activator)
MRPTWTIMIDALPFEPRKDSEAATRHIHGRLIGGAVAALVIVAAAFIWRITASPSPPIASALASPVAGAAAAAKNPVLDELVEATKALEVSQQQAIDQLQVVQELLGSQQAEIKKTSGEVAALSDKLESLRQSFASSSTPSPEEADAPQHEKSKPAVTHARGRTHRIVASRARTAAAVHH